MSYSAMIESEKWNRETLDDAWRGKAKKDYQEMRQEGLAIVGIVIAGPDSSFEPGPKTIRVRMEEEADDLQLIMAAREKGTSNRAEEINLSKIELFWQVWQKEAKKHGDKEVYDFIAQMRLALFGVEKMEWDEN